LSRWKAKEAFIFPTKLRWALIANGEADGLNTLAI
jgi:hypothetical protein